MYHWNRNLEVFFIAMIGFMITPYYQNWIYYIYEQTENNLSEFNLRTFYLSYNGFLTSMGANVLFALTLIWWGIKLLDRVPLIVAFSTLFNRIFICLALLWRTMAHQ